MQGVAAGKLNELLGEQITPKGDLTFQYWSRKGSVLNGGPCMVCCLDFNKNMTRIPSALPRGHLLYQNDSSTLHRLEAYLSRK